MNTLRKFTTTMMAGIGLAGPAMATDVTVYSSVQGRPPAELYRSAPGNADAVPGYAHVWTVRDVEVDDGAFSLAGWPDGMEPGTLILEPGDAPDVAMLEWHRPERDAAALLQAWVGREIVVEQQRGDSVDSFRGRLVSPGSPLVLAMADGTVRVISSWQGLRFPGAEPRVSAESSVHGRFAEAIDGRRRMQVGYLTGGLAWWLDYGVMATAEGECSLSLTGRTVLVNRSGADYPNARVALVAGTPHRADGGAQKAGYRTGRMEMEAMAAPASFGQAERVSEYYRYTLDRRVDLLDGTTVQRPLFETVDDIGCERERVMDNTRGLAWHGGVRSDRGFATGSADIAVYLRFANREDNGLGRPLPAGNVRVSTRDREGRVTFVGEDVMERVPAERNARLRIGTAFDLMGERIQTDFRYDDRQDLIEETYEIELTNGGDRPATVIVLEPLARSANWQMISSSQDFEKTAADRVRYEIDVPAKKSATVSYTVRYTW